MFDLMNISVGPSGTGAGIGGGNAGPGGVSAFGAGIASAQNGGVGFASGQGSASGNPFFGGFNAQGTGNGFGFGKWILPDVDADESCILFVTRFMSLKDNVTSIYLKSTNTKLWTVKFIMKMASLNLCIDFIRNFAEVTEWVNCTTNFTVQLLAEYYSTALSKRLLNS